MDKSKDTGLFGEPVIRLDQWSSSTRPINPGDRYFALVHTFPLLHIRDEAHLEQALAVIRGLIARRDRTKDETSYYLTLVDLVERYEAQSVDLPSIRGVELLRHLMVENGLRQANLAPLFGSHSVLSEILAGKRRLSLTNIIKLADRFNLPADAFIERRQAAEAIAAE